MGSLGTSELLIIALIIFVLFGSTKLPGAARSLGQSLRIFKAETQALRDDKPETTSQALPPSSAPESRVTVNGQPVANPNDPPPDRG